MDFTEKRGILQLADGLQPYKTRPTVQARGVRLAVFLFQPSSGRKRGNHLRGPLLTHSTHSTWELKGYSVRLLETLRGHLGISKLQKSAEMGFGGDESCPLEALPKHHPTEEIGTDVGNPLVLTRPVRRGRFPCRSSILVSCRQVPCYSFVRADEGRT